jgi:hypothetical protein
MKYYVLPFLFFAGCLMAGGELSKDALKQLEDAEIAGIRDDTIKNDDRKKIELLEINTFQNEDDDGEGFRIRVVVELKDKAKNLYIADFTGDRSGDIDSEYTGEDYFRFLMYHEDLLQLKVTGYAIQYGFMDDETFILLAEDYDDVKTLEELTERTKTPFPGKVVLKHYYMYDDVDAGESESIPQNIRKIRPKKTDSGE